MMPRRNRRTDIERANANLLGDDYRFTRDDELAKRRAEARRTRRDEAAKRMSQSWRRDWAKCIVPGCDFQTVKKLRETEILFPICSLHAAAVWMDVEAQAQAGEPWVQESVKALRARRAAIKAERAAEDAEAEAEYDALVKAGVLLGDVYFVRVNGLIKVGWSADANERLKAYGPGSEVLCVYPGTRQDETTLHRQLKPSRAHGREWYHDDEIMADFVRVAVEKYGPPAITIDWTKPKQVVAGKRAGRG